MTKKKKRVERCKRFDSFVSRDVRVMAGGYALWFENSDSGVGLMVRPSGVKSKWFLVSLEDPSKPLDLVCVEHEGVVAARGLVCSRSLPEFTGHEGGDPRFRPDPARWATKEMRQLVASKTVRKAESQA